MDTPNGFPASVDEYIATFPEDVRDVLDQLRCTIRQAAPGAEEVIKYRIPTFVFHGNLVHFAAFKNHVGFYPTPSAIEALKERLSEYQWAKGSVQFPLEKPMPLELIRSIVEFRVAEALRKVEDAKGKKTRRKGG